MYMHSHIICVIIPAPTDTTVCTEVNNGIVNNI